MLFKNVTSVLDWWCLRSITTTCVSLNVLNQRLKSGIIFNCINGIVRERDKEVTAEPYVLVSCEGGDPAPHGVAKRQFMRV